MSIQSLLDYAEQFPKEKALIKFDICLRQLGEPALRLLDKDQQICYFVYFNKMDELERIDNIALINHYCCIFSKRWRFEIILQKSNPPVCQRISSPVCVARPDPEECKKSFEDYVESVRNYKCGTINGKGKFVEGVTGTFKRIDPVLEQNCASTRSCSVDDFTEGTTTRQINPLPDNNEEVEDPLQGELYRDEQESEDAAADLEDFIEEQRQEALDEFEFTGQNTGYSRVENTVFEEPKDMKKLKEEAKQFNRTKQAQSNKVFGQEPADNLFIQHILDKTNNTRPLEDFGCEDDFFDRPAADVSLFDEKNDTTDMETILSKSGKHLNEVEEEDLKIPEQHNKEFSEFISRADFLREQIKRRRNSGN